MIKTTLAALIGLGLAATATAQESSLADNDRMVTGVTLADLAALVTSKGHTILSRNSDEVTVSAQLEDGLQYSMDGTACNDDKLCNGINIVVSYASDGGGSLEDLNTQDVQYAAASVWSTGSSYGISRYIILDGGMTMQNIKFNMDTILNIAPKVNTAMGGSSGSSTTTSSSSISFGDDSGSYANDGDCDDARFNDDGDTYNYMRSHVLHDATDCRAAIASGAKTLLLDFGDDSGTYSNDEECDDNRFTGEGRSVLSSDSHVRKDASDCIAAYRDDKLNRAS